MSSNKQDSSSIELLQQRIDELTAERDRLKVQCERAERQVLQEQEHVKALLASIARAEKSSSAPASSDNSFDDRAEDSAASLEDYFDPNADPLDELLGRDKSGKSNPQSLSSLIDRFKGWMNR